MITPLSPKNYYELHMRAMDEMPNLEEFLLGLCHVTTASTAGGAMVGRGGGPTNITHQHQNQQAPFTTQQLYEAVQWCPRVVPRLYLQICMGSVSIRAGSSEAVQVMEELGEAAKCVQCPVRGLFLRHYLLMALKDKLPDGRLEEAETSVDDGGKTQTEENGEGMMKMAPLTPVPSEGMNGVEDLGPTSPPPSLPPPPPPIEEGSFLTSTPLFSEGDSTSTPLFSEPVVSSPLGNGALNGTAFTTATSPTSNAPATTLTDATDGQPRKGTVEDSVEFILNNLFEMNRLWIRIQHMPGDKSKETKRRRERERNELRILVGSNLNRLSQLEGISAHTYGSKILPRVLEEVASCRDPLAQAYLMDCIIQVFPDEFHLETLEVFLGVIPRLRDKVNVRTILNNMMERLLHYYKDDLLVNDEVDTNDVKRTMAVHSFDMFEACVQRVFEARGMNIPPKDVVRLQGSLLNYTLKIAPGNIDHISRCIGQCARELETLQEQKKASMMGQGIVVGGGTKRSTELDMEEVAISELEKLLSVPLDQMALKVLELPDFSSLLAFLPWENRRKVAVSMIKAVVSGGDKTKVKEVAEEEQLFAIIAPLLRDKGAAMPASSLYEPRMDEGGSLISRTANLMGTLGISPSMMAGDSMYASNAGEMHARLGGDPVRVAQFRDEQELVAKLVNVLDHEDTDVVYQMLNVARKHINSGGAERTTVSMPPIVFSAMRLLRRVQEIEFPKPFVKEIRDETSKASEYEVDVVVEDKDNNPDESDASGDGGGGQPETTNDGTEAVEEEIADGEVDVKKQNVNEKETVESPGGKPNDQSSPSNVDEQPAPLFPTFSKNVNCRKILVFLQKSVAILSPNNPELAFKLYLEIAVATDHLAHATLPNFQNASTEFSGIAYDFTTQAFLVYEDEISESKAQIRAITSMVGSLLSCRSFERADYEALITKTAQYAAKLLKKPDQCRMVCVCSRLFYVGGKDVSAAWCC